MATQIALYHHQGEGVGPVKHHGNGKIKPRNRTQCSNPLLKICSVVSISHTINWRFRLSGYTIMSFFFALRSTESVDPDLKRQTSQ